MAQRQFAADSMTPSPISVTIDQYKDEMAQDRPMHEDCTPKHSNPTYTGRQFSDDWDGGYKAYGKTVEAMGASKSSVDIQPDNIKRGKEA